ARKADGAAHQDRWEAGVLRICGWLRLVFMTQVPGSGMRLMMLAWSMTSARPAARLRAVTRNIGLWQSMVGGTRSQAPLRPGPVPGYSIQYSGGAAGRVESNSPAGTARQRSAEPVGQILSAKQSAGVGICVSHAPAPRTSSCANRRADSAA